MIFSNCFAGMRNVLSRMPRAVRDIVSNPAQKIMQLAAPKSRIEDRIDLELKHTVHVDGRRDLHDSIGGRVRHVWLQEADMENRMDVHG